MNIGQNISEIEIFDTPFEAFQKEKITKIKLSDYKGKWLILMFYPADFTFVCPTELEEASTYYDKFRQLNAELLSISTDTVYVHKAWHDHSPAIKKITFPMVADPSGKLSRSFNTYLEDEGLSLRGTFIINPESVLKAFELNDNSIGRSAKELLRKLQAAIFVHDHDGNVCPASWNPGEDTLKPGLDLVGKI